jgi:23S rRNA (guanosine2251-2'-O)-methyltransferase
MKKPAWVIAKERARRAAAAETIWLFGLHAVADALANPRRRKLRLILTRNAAERLGEAAAAAGLSPEIADARAFPAPLDPGSVHQGAALEVRPLDWGSAEEVCAAGTGRALAVLLDRVTDPHNVGAILRSAEVFGARAVIAPRHHSAPETGALAKAASGALERQPYIRVANLADTMEALKRLGFRMIGLDGSAETTLAEGLAEAAGGPVALVLGSEGQGLRARTRAGCDRLVRIPAAGAFRSLNVSTAAAVALYAAATASGTPGVPGGAPAPAEPRRD